MLGHTLISENSARAGLAVVHGRLSRYTGWARRRCKWGRDTLDDLGSCSFPQAYAQYGGVCFETQAYPDAINHPHFPTIVLKPGETLNSVTEFKFL
jgi:hypothetical protein